jgi:hypothetical protein
MLRRIGSGKSRSYRGTALKAGIVGGLASILVIDNYVHSRNAHRTLETEPWYTRVAWFSARASGIETTHWSISHRAIHHNDESKEPMTNYEAFKHVFDRACVSAQSIQAMLDDPSKRSSLVFEGFDTHTDPIIKFNEDGTLEPKYQNRLDAWLANSQYGRVLGYAMLFGASYAITRRQGESIISNITHAGLAAVIFPSAMTAPGMFAAHEEFRNGFLVPTESGKDHGPVAELLLGNSALHGSHHRNPHLAHPPEGFGRDKRINSLLERIGLLKVTDGTPFQSED